MKLYWQIFVALGLAFLAGAWTGQEADFLGVRFDAVYSFAGNLFLNALKMIIVPLIVSSIITGVAGIGGGHGLGRLGVKTIGFYLTTSLLAILVGLFIVNLTSPGVIQGRPAKEILGLSSEDGADIAAKVGDRGPADLAGVFLSMVPSNVVAAAANGQMLGLIFFSILYGFFMTRIAETHAETQYRFWQGLFEIMMRITELVMKLAPIGVFGLVAHMVAGMKGSDLPSLVHSLGLFFVTVLVALAVHALVTLPLLLRFVARLSPALHFKAMTPALLTAFSTASSSATLPLTMDCVEKKAGVSNRTSSFVLPLGATVNMDGTALYECVAAMFIAQAYGLELSFTQQFIMVFVALLTSIGVAGVPAASLVAISIILSTIGLPVEAIGLILAVDRVLDMLRTAVNVFGDSCGAVIIGRLEGEEDILRANQ